MSKYDGYHTALAPEPFRLPILDRAVFHDGVAIRHDLIKGRLPGEFSSCDLIYSELPWRKGFVEFERRAGEGGRDYNLFLDTVRLSIAAIGAPAVMVTGIHAMKRLDPDAAFKVRLNGEEMLALSWKCNIPSGLDCQELLNFLAVNYGCVGDFCCGYGRAARAAREHGKRFVVSDYNGSCIRYIADTMSHVEMEAA